MEKSQAGTFLKKLWTLIGVVLIPVFVWVYWSAMESAGLHDVVGLDHALTAREITEGRGLNSAVVTPLHVRLEGAIDKAAPVLARPALALWEAAWFGLLAEPSDDSAVIAAGIFFIPAAWLVFLLAARFHSSEAAWVCFLVFVLNPFVLDVSTSGRPEAMGMFLVALLFYLLTEDRPAAYGIVDPPVFEPVRTGLVAGLLIQCVHYLALPLLAVLGWRWLRGSPSRRYSLRLAGLFFAGAFVPAFLVYAGRIFVDGPAPLPVDSFLLMVDTSVARGWSFWREFAYVEPSAWSFAMQFTPSLILKWLAGLSYGFNSYFEVFQPVVAALFILGLFLPEYGESRGLRWPVAVLISLHIATMALYYWDREMLMIWSPVVIVAGVGMFCEFLQQRYLRGQAAVEGYRTLTTRLLEEFRRYYLPLILLLLFAAGTTLLRLRDREDPMRLELTLAMETMKKEPVRYACIVTPAPWMVAWHTGARTLWMPEAMSYLDLLGEKYGSALRTIYLPRNRAAILHDEVPMWWYFAMRQPEKMPDYRVAEFSGFGEMVYLRKDAEP